MRKPILYTAGYTGLSVLTLLDSAKLLNALVVDVRLMPFSRNETWNKPKLQQSLGFTYHHITELGNLNYKGDLGEGVMLKDVERGTVRLAQLLKQQDCIILCACKDHTHCHRNDVATEMVQRYPTIQVNHLTASQLIILLTEPEPQKPNKPTSNQLKLF